MIRHRTRPLKLLLVSIVTALALLAAAGAGSALALAPHWHLVSRSAPSTLQVGQEGKVGTEIINLGDAPAVSTPLQPFVVTESLPAGVEATGPMRIGKSEGGQEIEKSSCSALPVLRCTYAGLLPAFIELKVSVPVKATKAGALGENEVKVEGGNVPPQNTRDPLTAGSEPVAFGVERYELEPELEDGSADLQAGSHPYQLTTTVLLNQTLEANKQSKDIAPGVPAQLKTVKTVLPVGLVANTFAIPKCTEVEFQTIRPGESDECPADTAIGVVEVTFKEPKFFPYDTEAVPVFNLVPEQGEPARFGIEFDNVTVTFDTSIRTGDGYAAEVNVRSASQAAEVLSTVLTIWGVPGDPSHDSARGWECLGGGHFVEGLEPVPPCKALGETQPPPFLTQTTVPCGKPLSTNIQVQSWKLGASLLPAVEAANPPTLEGCETLPFDPSLSVTPDERSASTPTGLTVEVKVPQNTTLSANGLAEADIAATTLALPEGMTANSGAADGLAACGVEEAGFAGQEAATGPALESQLGEQQFTAAEVTCPNASKIGEVTIHSPLLENDLTGSVYLGSQDTNPFASPLVLYVVAYDPVSGVRVKLAGEVRITATGQLISVFKNTPPVPFETLKLHLENGPRASQATPPYCRPYVTKASFTKSTGGEPVERSSTFTPESGPEGTACQSGGPLPFAPGFVAGSTNNHAGAFSPFTLTIKKPDADQPLKAIEVHLPAGAAAILASTTPCPNEQAEKDECSEASLVGHSTASAGLGSNPVTLYGDVYVTGPYKGAPFGLLAVTHAKAGPFNLGDVNVRSTINVNETTAAVTVTSDPLPQYVKGIPSEIKTLNVTVDRPAFEFNPTNCKPSAVTGALTGYEGGLENVSTPFQVDNCATLPFKPTIDVSIESNVSRSTGTGLEIDVHSSPGQANIGKTKLEFPKTVPSRLTTLQKSCRDTVFDVNPANCSPESIVGTAVAHTPVLKEPLTGPVYLVSHGNAAFPDAEIVLQGENGLKLLLDGTTDIEKGITISSFEAVPDAPVESFDVSLPRGTKSAFSGYGDLCTENPVMPTKFTGQNGAVLEQNTKIEVKGCAAVKAFHAESELTKNLKKCSKLSNSSKRAKCVASAHRRTNAVASCNKYSNKSKRQACAATARRKHALKL
jgi:hypothetical protein